LYKDEAIEDCLSRKLLEVCSEEDVFTAREFTPQMKGYRRLNVILLLRKGVPRKTVFSKTGKSRKPFYTWMSRFLEFGIDGFINKPRPGRPRILKEGEIKSSNKNSWHCVKRFFLTTKFTKNTKILRKFSI
jgi:uncharacterized protein YerC